MSRCPPYAWILPIAILSSAGAAETGQPTLQVGALRLAPRADPASQLVRARIEGNVPAGPWTATVTVPRRPPVTTVCGDLSPARTFFTLEIPALQEETLVAVQLACGAMRVSSSITLRPLRPWKIFILQHTHTDMGYTDFPNRLAVDHIDFLEEAVRGCDLTDSYPEDARFRWNCEATWAVERLFSQRPPELLARFLERVRQGRIEVTGMMMNMTDLATEEVVARSFYPVARLRRQGIPVRTAMQCDVNGYPWAMAEFFSDVGITGFVGGINETRSTLPFDFPRAIRWESPSGGAVLAWRGEHYMMANFLGFQETIETAITKLPPYLQSLEERGYPYDAVLLQMAGYYTDNAAPCHRVSDLVREWNERFAIPQVRVAVLSDFFAALGREPDAPAVRKAWPDWWADGVGSAALETAVVRDAQERLSFAEAFLALSAASRRLEGHVLPADPDWSSTIREAYLRACLYDEHTFGAAESVDRPFTINTKRQWAEKSMNAHRTNLLVTELESAALQTWAAGLVPRGKLGVTVFNALSWERSGPVRVRLSRGLVEEGTPFDLVDMETEKAIPYQIGEQARNYREIEFVASGVPSLGYRTYLLVLGSGVSPADDPFQVGPADISNGITAVRLDPARAAVASIAPAGGGENIVDATAAHGFNQYVHERIVHEKGRWYLWPAPATYDPAAFKVTVPAEATVAPGSKGPVRRSLILQSRVAVANGAPPGPGTEDGMLHVETEVSLYRSLPGVYIENRIQRPEVFGADSGYFAFPFAAGGPPRADLVGGVMVPGADQIPRSADDWHAIQRWVRLEGGGRDAVWVTVDAPLIQFGGLNTGRYGKGLTLDRPLVYSWVTNNYWFTNFLASQRGSFVFRYAVAGGKEAGSDAAANRFAREVCCPLRAAAVEGRGERPARKSLFEVEPGELSLVAVKSAEDDPGAIVIRVRNYSAHPVRAVLRPALSSPPARALRTSIIEEVRGELPLEGGAAIVTVGPWDLETVMFRWK